MKVVVCTVQAGAAKHAENDACVRVQYISAHAGVPCLIPG